MNATELLTELRPALEDPPADDATIERILLSGPVTAPRRRRFARPIAVAAATAVAATAAVALLPAGESGPTGLAGAVAALSEPDVLLHFKVTTTHSPSGAVEPTTETWQTPDGRRRRSMYGNGLEFAYDQRARVLETYAPERNEVIAQTDTEFFEDERDPFGSIATTATSGPGVVGDLPALVTRALSGEDPDVRHLGTTTVRGIEVDQIRISQDIEVADVEPGASPRELKNAASKTVTLTRDVYVRHDDALPVRVVDRDGRFTSTSDFTDVEKLTLDATTEQTLRLPDHPGATRRVMGPFDDSKADSGD